MIVITAEVSDIPALIDALAEVRNVRQPAENRPSEQAPAQPGGAEAPASSETANLHLLDRRGGLQAGARAVNRDGHQNDLLEQQLGLMLAWEPQNVLKWLVNNPDGPDDPEEQMATLRDLLEDAGEPEDAAASLLEWVRGPDAGGGRVGVPVPGGRVAVASRR